MSKRGFARAAAAFALAAVLFITAPFTAWAAGSITLTFVRHGESQANADGVIDSNPAAWLSSCLASTPSVSCCAESSRARSAVSRSSSTSK